MSEIMEIKVGVGRYKDGSGYEVVLRYEAPDKDHRWPRGILWINDHIISGPERIEEMIEALRYIRDQLGALPSPHTEKEE